MNLKNKTVCIVDNGLFVSFARKIAPAFGRALYHKPFQNAFPNTNDLAPGRGFDELEWCEQPLLIADDIDLWVFLDLFQSGLQVFLRERGARVWGAGIGEDMELHRWEFKQHLKSLGLPVQHCEQVFGMDELRKCLKAVKKNVYVKTSYVRGDFETFKCENYELIEPRLDQLAYKLGVKKDTYEFIIEDEISDAVEIGYDGFTIDGQFPEVGMMAYEIKDAGMIGVVKPYEQLADPVKLINKKLIPDFKDSQYRGFFCSEIRYTKAKESFFIDPCCRLGAPSNELLQELFGNWPEVIWNGAEGIITTPDVQAKFGCLAIINSEWAGKDWLNVHYPKEIDQFVKLGFSARKGKLNYVVPQPVQITGVGCVVGTGATLKEAVDLCKERAKMIKGFQVDVNIEALDKGLAVIKEGEKFGIKF